MNEPRKRADALSEGLWQRQPVHPRRVPEAAPTVTEETCQAQQRYMRRKLNWREALTWWARGRPQL